jgi:NAD(P)-dependent dehydrogenase (short-subunit alcohol dehydrogenase family)
MTTQTILITGSGTGFGRLMAEALAERGHTVVATMRDPSGRNAKAATELRDGAKSRGQRLFVVEMDITDDASVEQGFREALKLAGPLDAIVNNAGVLYHGHTEAFTSEEFLEALNTNLVGAHRVSRAALPHLRERGRGLLLFVSSVSAQMTFPFIGIYGSAKAALSALAEAYSYELAPLGVDAVLLEAGGFHTALFDRVRKPADTARSAAYGPLAEVPRQHLEAYAASLSAPGAPDPKEVSEATVRLIETPAGQRPFRTIVDPSPIGPAARASGELRDRLQAEILTAFGMGDFLKLKDPAH